MIQKENTSAMWHREEQVVRMNPDLVVCHLSCLLDIRPAAGQPRDVANHLFDVAAGRLVLFLGYVGASNPRTRFVVYSRTRFATPELIKQWVEHVVGRSGEQTFRDPEAARLIRARVTEVLGLEGNP